MHAYLLIYVLTLSIRIYTKSEAWQKLKSRITITSQNFILFNKNLFV